MASRGRDGLLRNGQPGPPPWGPFDCDERWKGAQLADARKGIYWGKYGKQKELEHGTEVQSGADSSITQVGVDETARGQGHV